MIVGTAGHVDHGKTSLVAALTGVDTDRLKAEKERGITIELGFAYLPAPDGKVIGFVDVPGHERFVHTMLAGASGIDFALLLVAADDGPMPQTREHLAILDLLGVRRGLVVLSKADLADAAERALLGDQIRAALLDSSLANADIVAVSTRTGEGVATLRDRLFAEAGRVRRRSEVGRFRLTVDRSFTLAGTGTIVTGTVLSGAVAVGDRVTVGPHGLACRVRSLHAQNREAARGIAGERCALNLAGDGVGKDRIARGDVVLDPTLHAPSDRIDVALDLLASETRPVGIWHPVRLHHGATSVGARIVPLESETISPGIFAFAQLVLERPIEAAVGDRFVLRDVSAQRTIAGGRLVDLRAPTRRRRTQERLDRLAAMARLDATESLASLLEIAPHHVELNGFARDRALASDTPEVWRQRLDLMALRARENCWAMTRAHWLDYAARLVDAVTDFHEHHPDLQGIGSERLRLQLTPRLPVSAFRIALGELARDGTIALEGAWVRLVTHTIRLTPVDEELWHGIRSLLGGVTRFRPPRVRDIAGMVDADEADLRRLLKRVARMGMLDEIAHDHFFLRATTAEMVAIVRDVASQSPPTGFVAAQFRDRVENGRKVAIEILEFFDRHGVTLRRGDLRRFNAHREDLFAPIGLAPTATQLSSVA